MNLLRAILFVSLAACAGAAEPLHARIDQLVAAGQVGPMAGQTTDGEFLRRVYLDLIGRIPSALEARSFLDNSSPNKRKVAVDHLLASPEYARHMATVIDVMLMERRADKHVKGPEWRGYLRDSFAANKPWNKLAAEIMAADGNSTAIPRAAVKFILDRDAEPNLVTRDLGRKFFGMDLQCAQCHDHPTIDDYFQRDYYGLYAFVSRSFVFQPDKKKPAMLAEKASGEATFKSVFTSVSGGTRPRLPAGLEFDEPVFAPGEEWLVAPNPKDKKKRSIPKYSRRAKLASHAAENQNFRRNITNRLWGHMMGRALVEPRDGLHTDNPAAHPHLLGMIADEFAAMNYDIRAFLRELALTQTYQRSFALPASLKTVTTVSMLEAVHKEQSARVESAQAEYEKALAAVNTARGERFTAQAGLDKTLKPVAAAKKVSASVAKALGDSQKKLVAKQKAHQLVVDLAANAKAVADQLKGDKELAEPAAKLKAKADKLAAEVAAAQKDIATKKAAVQVAAGKLTAVQKINDTARAKWTEIDKKVQVLDQAWQGKVRQREKAKAVHALSLRRLEDTKALVEMGQLQSEFSDAQVEVVVAEAALAKARTAMPPLTAVLAKQRKPFIAAQQVHVATAAILAKAQNDLAAKQANATSAATAVTNATVGRKLVADAEALVGKNKFLGTVDGLKKPVTNASTIAQSAIVKLQALQGILEKDAATAQKKVADSEKIAQATKVKLDAAAIVVRSVEEKIAAMKKREQQIAGQVTTAKAEASSAGAAVAVALEKLGARWTENYGVGAIKHLSPEQLCWSMLEATGQVAAQRAAALADFDKKNSPRESTKENAVRTAARAKHVENFVYDKLKSNTATFVKLFGGAAGEVQTDFFATADQALYFANGGTVCGWLGTLAGRLTNMEEPNALAEELYLTVLTRWPTTTEKVAVLKMLVEQNDSRTNAIREMAWGLMTSTEFRFNH